MLHLAKRYKKHLIGLSALALISFVCLTYLPWRLVVQNKLEHILQEKGFENAKLTLSGLSLSEAQLENATIGKNGILKFKNLTLNYSLSDLWNGNLQTVILKGLALEVRQLNGKWNLEGYQNASSESSGSFAFLPLTQQQISAFPLNDLTIEDSRLTVISDKWSLVAPLHLMWHRDQQPSIALENNDIQFLSSNTKVTAEHAEARALFNANSAVWQGSWKISNIHVSTSLPMMQASGTLQADNNKASASGSISSSDNIYAAQFKLEMPLEPGEQPLLTINKASMIWKSGKITIQDVQIPLAETDPIKFTIRMEKISVDELLQALTGKRVSATGTISGSIPIIVGRDGSLSFGQGNLQSTGEGQITMPEDALPGDNPQIQLTRDVLKNFHYKNLSISLQNQKGGEIALLLALDGNNPDVYEGRPVKLNVNLSGDILDFIKENAMLMNSPETILKQDGK